MRDKQRERPHGRLKRRQRMRVLGEPLRAALPQDRASAALRGGSLRGGTERDLEKVRELFECPSRYKVLYHLRCGAGADEAVQRVRHGVRGERHLVPLPMAAHTPARPVGALRSVLCGRSAGARGHWTHDALHGDVKTVHQILNARSAFRAPVQADRGRKF